ncbi:hypothetical protein OROGR_010747 [Orobanche gracilis]
MSRTAATSQEDADGEQSQQQFEEAFVDLVEEENNQNDGSMFAIFLTIRKCTE